jgi:hypothetical protein
VGNYAIARGMMLMGSSSQVPEKQYRLAGHPDKAVSQMG